MEIVTVVIVAAAVALLTVLALLLVPRGSNVDDGPLPTDVETRLLLGERPEDIDQPAVPHHPESHSSSS